MKKEKYDELKKLHELKETLLGCQHSWRFVFNGSKYIWYCVKCRKTEDYNGV